MIEFTEKEIELLSNTESSIAINAHVQVTFNVSIHDCARARQSFKSSLIVIDYLVRCVLHHEKARKGRKLRENHSFYFVCKSVRRKAPRRRLVHPVASSAKIIYMPAVDPPIFFCFKKFEKE